MTPDRRVKKTLIRLGLVLSLLITGNAIAQSTAPDQKMSVNDRLVKARAAKADKQAAKASGNDAATATIMTTGNKAPTGMKADPSTKTARKVEKATPADYKAPVDQSQRGPNGEVVRSGARGGQYYINKNGNKTYLSSNQ